MATEKVVKPVASGGVNQGMSVPRGSIIVDASFNVRRTVEESSVKALVADIKMRGLLHPVTVQSHKAGEYKVVAGFTRMAALDALGWKMIPVTVMSDTSKEAGIFANLAENVSRDSIPTFDLAVKLADIKSRLKLSANEIAARLVAGEDDGGKRLSKGHINNLINLATNLHPTLIKLWENGNKVTLPQLLSVVSLPVDSQVQALAEKAGLKPSEITGEKPEKGSEEKEEKGSGDAAPRISKPGEGLIKAALKAVENTKVKMTENEVDALKAAFAFIMGTTENLALGSRIIFAPEAYKASIKAAAKEAKEKAAQGAAVPAP